QPRTSAVLALLLAAACGGDPPADPGPGPDTEVASLVIAGGDLSFASLGLTAQLTVTARNAAGDALTPAITWSAAGGGVASVSGTGLVTAKANGNTTITATAGSKSATVQVTVAQVATGIAITTPPTQLTI